MDKSLVVGFLLALGLLTGIYGLENGREVYGQPWAVGLLFFASWGLVAWLFERGKQPQRQPLPKTVPTDTPNPAPKPGKVLHMGDYTKKEVPLEALWMPVYSSEDQAMIGMVQSILASREVPTQITNQHMAGMFPKMEGLTMDLMVPKEFYERARKILLDHQLIQG